MRGNGTDEASANRNDYSRPRREAATTCMQYPSPAPCASQLDFREKHRERRAPAFLARHRDPAVVHVQDLPRHREPEPGPGLLRREEGMEDLPDPVRGDSGAVVGD